MQGYVIFYLKRERVVYPSKSDLSFSAMVWMGWGGYLLFREGFRKKNPYFLWSFAKPGGGGSARVVKKPYCFFEKVFFQRACRIILVPPKHDLHLVWSPFFIYTAIRTALKVACKARILGKRRSISKNKKVKFWNGTKCKICFTHL